MQSHLRKAGANAALVLSLRSHTSALQLVLHGARERYRSTTAALSDREKDVDTVFGRISDALGKICIALFR